MSGKRSYESFAAFTLSQNAPFFNSFLRRYRQRTAQLCAYLNQTIFGLVCCQRPKNGGVTQSAQDCARYQPAQLWARTTTLTFEVCIFSEESSTLRTPTNANLLSLSILPILGALTIERNFALITTNPKIGFSEEYPFLDCPHPAQF